MRQKINFIEHYKSITEQFIDDNTINTNEIAMYHSLFSIWNKIGFQDEFTIQREQVKMMCGISSNNTYSKTLQSLDNKGYIKYYPSRNWHKGSKVSLLKINTNGGQQAIPMEGNKMIHYINI